MNRMSDMTIMDTFGHSIVQDKQYHTQSLEFILISPNIRYLRHNFYNQILINHQLDGIVFLQPSLGLFSVANYFYQQEILAYGDSSMLNDFYQNFGIKYNSSIYYFMGDLDNLMLQSRLLSAGLVQIYGLTPKSNNWVKVNYTYDPDPSYHNQFMNVDNLTITYIRTIAGNGFPNAVVEQKLIGQQQQCITFNLTNATKGNTGTSVGIGNVNSLKRFNFSQGYNSAQYGLFSSNGGQSKSYPYIVITNY